MIKLQFQAGHASQFLGRLVRFTRMGHGTFFSNIDLGQPVLVIGFIGRQHNRSINGKS